MQALKPMFSRKTPTNEKGSEDRFGEVNVKIRDFESLQ